MTQSNDSARLMQKAIRALASAPLLLDAGDTDGAWNRAYYAMSNAAVNAVRDYLDRPEDAAGTSAEEA